MVDTSAPPTTRAYSLDDRYRAVTGSVVLSGLQAVTRSLLDRQRLDALAGLRSGGVASGYPGSPLGGLDLTFGRARAVLAEHDVVHIPGVNEELAAAVVWGTQQPHTVGLRAGFDGVFGMWYGKSPGADRCGDVFKHANALGVHHDGGVLAVVGDDPAAKSSSLPSQTETVFYDASMPVLAAGSVQELLDLAVAGWELSRFSGCWVGLKVVTNVADGVGSVDVDLARHRFSHPLVEIDGAPWVHRQRLETTGAALIDRERDLLRDRHVAAQAFAAANGLNRIAGATGDAWIGFAAAGKTYHDLRQALSDLGYDDALLARHGIRLLQLGMVYPLEAGVVGAFARGLERVVVVEEKRDFIEGAVKGVLYHAPDRPVVVGKRDEEGRPLFPVDGELTADRIRPLLRAQLAVRLDVPEPAAPVAISTGTRASAGVAAPVPAGPGTPVLLGTKPAAPLVARTAAYCSGCPHNRSTVLPEGAVMGGGVGCHGMSYFDPRTLDVPKLNVVPMGAEGVPWIGLAPFADADHIFQNLGDGTYTHSGLLGIRACVAAQVNITYKILYNGYIAMTGGQDVAGGLTVPAMTRELEAEGVARIIVCADDPSRYRKVKGLAPGVEVWHRDRVLEAQEALRAVPGVTVLIYDQVCAAEARRLRRRGELPTPARSIVINERVCEGCGDCSAKSNCLSVQPVDTELGRKTQIHQSSCNQDYSCLLGDCPSFVSVVPRRSTALSRRRQRKAAARAEGSRPRRGSPAVAAPAEPVAKAEVGEGTYSIYMVGIGGTGVVTANQVLATAALLDGLRSNGLDQTGMSQKAGPVSSHLKLSRGPLDEASAVGGGEADLYLVFDLLGGAADAHLAKAGPDRTAAVVSTSAVPTSSIVTDVGTSFPQIDGLLERVAAATRPGTGLAVDAVALAEAELGDHVLANVLLVGVAYQAGLLPLTAASVERAIELNGVAVEKNLAAFRLGRRWVVDPASVSASVAADAEVRLGESPLDATPRAQAAARRLVGGAGLPAAVADACLPLAAELVDYQDEALAARYVATVARVAAREREVVGEATTDLAVAVARNLFKLLAYKDEYEVARLHLAVDVEARAAEELGAPVRLSYHLHPPVLKALGVDRKIAVGPWIRPAFRALKAGRRLRGTPLDVFGYAKLRKVERALVAEYRAAVEEICDRLTPERHQGAVAAASAPELVRGYEEVKLAGIPAFRERLAAGRA